MRNRWRFAARVHLWLGLFVGIQVLIWTASGLFFAIVPIETVRGEHLKREIAPTALPATGLAPLDQILNGPVSRAELVIVAGSPVWRLDADGKPAKLVDARDGTTLSPLSADWAGRIALEDYAGKGKITSLKLIAHDAPVEYRGALPVWQVQFDDPENSRLYIAPLTGKVAARRTDTWRVYDFLWSLHIMDYRAREDFNHPLLIVAAASAVVLALFGLWLAFLRFRVIGGRWLGMRRR